MFFRLIDNVIIVGSGDGLRFSALSGETLTMHDGPQAGRLLFTSFDKGVNDNGYGCNENFNECIHNLGFKRLIKLERGSRGGFLLSGCKVTTKIVSLQYPECVKRTLCSPYLRGGQGSRPEGLLGKWGL